jgi:hypothetical protein
MGRKKWKYLALCSCLFTAFLQGRSDAEYYQSTGEEKQNYLSLSGDFLYLKAVEDSLEFAVRTPWYNQNGISYSGSFIGPRYRYDPGFRLALFAPIGMDHWEVGLVWMNFHNRPRSTYASSSKYDLYTVLTQSSAESAGTDFVNNVMGRWALGLNVVDFLMQKELKLSSSFSFTPLLGVEGSLIRQHLHVGYTNYLDTSLSQPPQAIYGKNVTWGVGPKVGLDMCIKAGMGLSLDFLAAFSSLFGKSNAATYYNKFINLPPDSSVAFTLSRNRLFSTMQLQAAIEESWKWGGASLSLKAGWETQIWFRQLRLNFMGTLDAPASGSDLTLQGPFARASLAF